MGACRWKIIIPSLFGTQGLPSFSTCVLLKTVSMSSYLYARNRIWSLSPSCREIYFKTMNTKCAPPPSYASISMTVRPCKQTQSPGFAAEHMATVKGGGRGDGGSWKAVCADWQWTQSGKKKDLSHPVPFGQVTPCDHGSWQKTGDYLKKQRGTEGDVMQKRGYITEPVFDQPTTEMILCSG